MYTSLVVFFEDPFWVGLFEVNDEGQAKYCRVVFGSEPALPDVYALILWEFYKLKFTDSISTDTPLPLPPNPKRLNRQIRKELKSRAGISKSRDAIKKSLEENAAVKKARNSDLEKAKQEKKRILKIEKKKEKHRGH
jgi:hypothetical protein